MPMNFQDTPMGRKFFMKDVPSLIEAVSKLAEATERSNALAEGRMKKASDVESDELGYYMVYNYGDFGNKACYAENMSEVNAELVKLDELGISRESVLILPVSNGFNILKDE